MAEEDTKVDAELQPCDDNEDPTQTPGYKPPAQKSVAEIEQLDQDDESLVKYKKQLLGQLDGVTDEGGNNVLVKQMIFRTDGREDITIDLTGDVSKLKQKPIVIKEGVEYCIVIKFRVQREIVAGLRYYQETFRKGIKVDKSSFMVGSYGPKTEFQEYTTKKDEAPKGMIARGHYTIKSKFFDDDKNIYLEWEWSFDIKKDWE
ncbi:rho GDP-dissociation inhibitor 1-like [Diadema setosum]|uniref:rho GDP-dissociation inhibitor 1-like n=1 Tax=Diadema setosum TaxID=31175 RepID=UPI003B3A7426